LTLVLVSFYRKANLESQQVLHGCRQLVPWGVRLIPETSATCMVYVWLFKLPNCRQQAWRKDKMMSSRHGPNEVGHSCVTKVMTKLFRVQIWNE